MSNFINDKNKNLLLELILDKNKNTNREYVNSIVNILNTSINEIINKYNINVSKNLTYTQVLNLNRELLLLTEKKIKIYDINNDYLHNNKLNNITINVSEREKLRQTQFDDNLLKKQRDFDSYKQTPPKNISFKDEIDDKHIGDEMDNLIAKAVEMREKQIKQIFINPNLNINQENKEKLIDNEIKNIKKLNIGEDILINENIIDLSNYSKSNESLDSNLNVLFNSLKIKSNENTSENINNRLELLEKKINKLEYLLNDIIIRLNS